jgi:MYXO-CTERM domain-containing protein
MRTHTLPARRRLRLALLAAAVTTSAAVPLRRAEACGGFFCNQPQDPNNLPVAQTAENVLFAMDRTADGKFALEAHVQIFYTGPADKFSWVVPVDNQPTVAVGSNGVFAALLAATRPRFTVGFQDVGTCRPPMFPPPQPPMSSAGGSVDAAGAADSGTGGVNIAFRGDVGPYDAAVIKSTDPQDSKPLIDWLITNQYFVTDEAKRLIADYVRQEKFFVAIKLLPQKGVTEIVPLVMRFAGPGHCIPLKLTAIAALKDLKINLWVLADQRVVPDNVYEMEINPARINWFDGGSNYDDLVKAAANEAGGNAFITEFAGPTTQFKDQIYQPNRYNVAAIQAAKTPPEALDRIGQQPFPRDATLLEILRRQIPEPAVLKNMGVMERDFYNGLATYWQMYQKDFSPFDPLALAAELDMKFIQPSRQTQELLDGHKRLTRLSTFISPEEMTIDPTFTMNSSLPDVPVERKAIGFRYCGNMEYDACTAPLRLRLPDGQDVWLKPEQRDYPCYGIGSYQRKELDSMPALYRGWVRSSAGEGMAKLDNDKLIRDAVAVHNAALAASLPDAGIPTAPDAGVDAASGAGGAGGGVPTGGNKGSGGATSGAAGGQGGDQDGSGCSCSVGDAAAAPPLLLPLLAGLGLLVARRRRR